MDTKNLPISINLNKLLWASYTNKGSYKTQLNVLRRFRGKLIDNGGLAKSAKISTLVIPGNTLIECLRSIGDTNLQKNMLFAIIKLANLEENTALTTNRDFEEFSRWVVENNRALRANRQITDIVSVDWEYILDKSNKCIVLSKERLKERADSNTLNKLILAAFICDMPVLRTGEYSSIMLVDEAGGNYLKATNRDIGPGASRESWFIVLRNYRASPGVVNTPREIPVSPPVIDLLVRYGPLIWSAGATHLFRNKSGRALGDAGLGALVGEIYGADITISKIRSLFVYYYAPKLGISGRAKMAEYMNRTLDRL